MSEFNYKQPFIAVAAIIVKEDKVLMVKEAHGPDVGRWSLPAGKWDHEESLLDGIKREVLEETGYKFEPGYLLGVYTIIRTLPNGDKSQVLRPVFVGSISGEQVELSEDVEETKWIPINGLDDIDYRSPDIKIMLRDFEDGVKYPLELLKHHKAL